MAKKNKSNNNFAKAKPRKDTSVFKVAGSKVGKAKGKAKAVTTSLKKLDKKLKTNTKIEQVDAAYGDVRATLLEQQKKHSSSEKQKTEKPMRTEELEPPPPDLDAAALEFSKL